MTADLGDRDYSRHEAGGFVSRPTLEEYAGKYAEHVTISRHQGIVEMRLHHGDGPALYGPQARNAWGQALRDIGNDPDNEVLIVTGTGDYWVKSYSNSIDRPFREWPADMAYEHLYRDMVKLAWSVAADIDIPVIAAINGPGMYREFALFADITLCSDTTVFADLHASRGQVPGGGLQIAFQLLMGPKAAAYYLYTSDTIDAQKALRLGLVNEVLPPGRVLPRAREIAADIMRMPRISRHLTHEIVQRPVRRRLGEDFGFGLGSMLFGLLAEAGADPSAQPGGASDAGR